MSIDSYVKYIAKQKADLYNSGVISEAPANPFGRNTGVGYASNPQTGNTQSPSGNVSLRQQQLRSYNAANSNNQAQDKVKTWGLDSAPRGDDLKTTMVQKPEAIKRTAKDYGTKSDAEMKRIDGRMKELDKHLANPDLKLVRNTKSGLFQFVDKTPKSTQQAPTPAPTQQAPSPAATTSNRQLGKAALGAAAVATGIAGARAYNNLNKPTSSPASSGEPPRVIFRGATRGIPSNRNPTRLALPAPASQAFPAPASAPSPSTALTSSPKPSAMAKVGGAVKTVGGTALKAAGVGIDKVVAPAIATASAYDMGQRIAAGESPTKVVAGSVADIPTLGLTSAAQNQLKRSAQSGNPAARSILKGQDKAAELGDKAAKATTDAIGDKLDPAFRFYDKTRLATTDAIEKGAGLFGKIKSQLKR